MRFVLLAIIVSIGVVAKTEVPLLRFNEKFRCQVCHKFCNEYERKIKDKKGDDPFEIAVQNARGNTSNYRWDDEHEVLRPAGQSIGESVIDEIYTTLDTFMLTPYNTGVILHALHAAAHLQRPPQMNAIFCQRVFCTEHLTHCPPHDDTRPFGEMQKAYRHFVEEFDHQQHNRRGARRRQAGARSDIYKSEVRQAYKDSEFGRFDPANLDEEHQRKLHHDLHEADRKARYYRADEDL